MTATSNDRRKTGPGPWRQTATGLAAFGGGIGGAIAGGVALLAADTDLLTHLAVNLTRGALVVVIYATLGAALGALWSVLATSVVSSSDADGDCPMRTVAPAAALAAVASLVASPMSSGENTFLWLQLAIVFGAVTLISAAWYRAADFATRTVASLGSAVLVGSFTLAVGLRLAESGRVPGGALTWAVVIAIATGVGYAAWLGFTWLSAALENRMGRARAAKIAPAVIAALLLALGVPGLVSEVRGWQTWERKLAAVEKADEGEGNPPPNVILISVDTLRADSVGYAGGDVRTPTLDRLAEQSFVFENAFSVAPWTRSSFAAFFGGRYPSEMGVGRVRGGLASGDASGAVPYQWNADHKRPVEALQEAGYYTAAVVVNPHLSQAAHADKGFDFYYHTEIDYVQPHAASSVVRTLDKALLPFVQLTQPRFELERAPVITSYTAQFLEHLKARPTVLWMHYVDPHFPYDPPTLEEEKKALGDTTALQAGLEAITATRREMYREAYAREVDYWDQWFDEAVGRLKAAGLWDDSVVVFWSDHGEEFWEHGDWGHGQSLFNEQVHIPLVIHLPGQTKGVRISRHVSLLDVMPSVLDLCEVEHPEGLRGRSLMPAFEGRPDRLEPLHAYLESCVHGSLRKALLNDRYKLIYEFDADQFSLFDLQEDPAERHNIFGTDAAPDTAAMEADLRDWTDLSLAMMAEAAGKMSAEEISPQIRQQLRDMGYIQ